MQSTEQCMRVVDTVAYRVQSLQDESDDMQTVQVAADTDDVVTLADPESLQGVQLLPSSQANVTRIRTPQHDEHQLTEFLDRGPDVLEDNVSLRHLPRQLYAEGVPPAQTELH
eukprot:2500424-Rhodomonas_salina.1